MAAALLVGSKATAAITGVCPDGSVYIVQTEQAIPCKDSKQVEPDEVPPLRPEYLPRPYTWEVYQRDANPNNPYNLLDSARQVREMRDNAATPSTAGQASNGSVSAPPPAWQARSQAPREPVSLGLTDGELRDLFLIVELSQRDVPARFEKRSAMDEQLLEVSLAHSASFQKRFSHNQGAAPVLLFSAIARADTRFDPNFSFVQGHLSFHPRADDPYQLGVLQGQLGPLSAGDMVLGYVALPPQVDLSRPIEVYWDDRRLSVTF